MKPDQKVLLPYNDNYVLINKRSLLTNGAVMDSLISYIAKERGVPEDQVAMEFGLDAVLFFQKLSQEEINNRVSSVIASHWKASSSKLSITTVCNPPDEAV
ncbi:hypothetical protein FJR11_20325 [Anabaena sp. UHCC 0187]|uniref:hypothetical protein n=1 Tax=Anabaena sp. UHCC 0187 TaxID=2590018 RepID=UPI001447ABED|nr:hypothetical protein [Anabaena sp. UHCC 0187]MTJ12211.1 hypothetical protein [Anabaena sp. UHCC 0187]MTJ14879.1 hypothetical protein [Anabaena sp. UHCC 0187]